MDRGEFLVGRASAFMPLGRVYLMPPICRLLPCAPGKAIPAPEVRATVSADLCDTSCGTMAAVDRPDVLEPDDAISCYAMNMYTASVVNGKRFSANRFDPWTSITSKLLSSTLST